jgi:hypothetical protein
MRWAGGVFSRTGRTQYVAPGQLSSDDLATMALGFTLRTVTEAQRAREEYTQARQTLPDILQEIRSGNVTDAVHDMLRLGMTRGEIRSTIRQTPREKARGYSDRGFRRYEERQGISP